MYLHTINLNKLRLFVRNVCCFCSNTIDKMALKNVLLKLPISCCFKLIERLKKSIIHCYNIILVFKVLRKLKEEYVAFYGISAQKTLFPRLSVVCHCCVYGTGGHTFYIKHKSNCKSGIISLLFSLFYSRIENSIILIQFASQSERSICLVIKDGHVAA